MSAAHEKLFVGRPHLLVATWRIMVDLSFRGFMRATTKDMVTLLWIVDCAALLVWGLRLMDSGGNLGFVEFACFRSVCTLTDPFAAMDNASGVPLKRQRSVLPRPTRPLYQQTVQNLMKYGVYVCSLVHVLHGVFHLLIDLQMPVASRHSAEFA